jgi:polysaccharide deacetylase 2 family uncharacterized protein YibQ
MRLTNRFTLRIFALLLAGPLLLGLGACRRKAPPLADPDHLAADFAAAARGAAGAESSIRIVPAVESRGHGLTRVLVSLPDSARLSAVETVWRSAAAERGVALEPREAGTDVAAFAVLAGVQVLVELEVFQVAAAPPSAAQRGHNAPELAIIVDDLGYDPAAARAVFALPSKVSVAVLPNLPESPAIAEEAHRRGFEVLLHLPMESLGGEDAAEKIELRVGEPAAEVSRVLDQMLLTVPHAAGVNNHQGSRATADAALMAALAAALRERGLFFIDSRTSAATRALDAARRAGVPAAARNVFLDDDEQAGAVRRQLEHAERLAREQGWCVAIGHPHGVTLDVLADALPEVEARGVRLVSASEIIRITPQ